MADKSNSGSFAQQLLQACASPIYLHHKENSQADDAQTEDNKQAEQMDKNIYWWKPKLKSFTYDQAKEYAKELDGRLLTLDEVDALLKLHGGVLYKGHDEWIPCASPGEDGDERKDWVQLADKFHKPGRTHREWGWPRWADRECDVGRVPWR